MHQFHVKCFEPVGYVTIRLNAAIFYAAVCQVHLTRSGFFTLKPVEEKSPPSYKKYPQQ